jgi:hypothetical protein
MLASVIRIDNLKGAGKVLGGQIPLRPVAHHHLLSGTAPAAFPGFRVKSSAKLFGGSRV